MIRSKKLRREKFFILSYDKKTALTAAVIVSFILAFVMFSSSLYYSKSLDVNSCVDWFDFISLKSIVTLLANTLGFYWLLRLQFWAFARFQKQRYVMWLILLGLLAVVVLLSSYLSRLQWWWFRDKVSTPVYSTLHYVKDLMILIVSFLFTLLIYLISENQKRVTENQSLVIENLKNRYNALKSQINPHFLFNSLNTLTGLIGYDNERAQEYVSQLSKVFRYTMQNREVVRLSEEVRFAESYIYLMKIRYHDGLQVQMEIAERYENRYIIPSGLQVLIENAIKHNVVSTRNPLHISIETTPGGTIRVKNNLCKKTGESVSNGLGLANLNEQYRLMFDEEIVILADEEMFLVELPLIEDMEGYHAKCKRDEGCKRG